jgi:hypothetical protein
VAQPTQGIDGDLLVLTDKTALPPRCVRTNLPVSEREYRTWDLPCTPTWLRILMILLPAFLLFAPFVVRHRCRLKAGLSRNARYRYLLLKLLAIVLILWAIIAPIAFAGFDRPDAMLIYVAAFPFLFWGGFILLIMFSSPLTVIKHEGDKFWIKGCSPAFLESLKESLAESAPETAS